MTAVFSAFFISQLEANSSLLNPATIGLYLYRQAPVFVSNDDRYTGVQTLGDLLILPGWVEAAGVGYPLTNTISVTTRSVGSGRYIMFDQYPFTGLGQHDVIACSFYYVGTLGGVTNPLILTTNTPFPDGRVVVKDGDAITAIPDTTLTGSNRWMFSWAASTGTTSIGLSEGPLALVRGAPVFETSHTQHVWLYPQRCNYIANPSFEAPGTAFWSTNGTALQVEDPAPVVDGGVYAGQFSGTISPLVVESNRFLTQGEEYWTIQLMAKGNGLLRIGFVWWRDTYDSTLSDFGEEIWTLSPLRYTHITVCRNPVQTYEGMLRLEFTGPTLNIDRVLCERGMLKDWMYFDGNTTYGARGDFSWYGGQNRQGASYSLWYNNKHAVFGQLFHRNIDDTQLVTDQDVVLEEGLSYQWVPAGILVTPHIDVLYPNDLQAPVPPKPPGVLPYGTDISDTGGVFNPWPGVIALTSDTTAAGFNAVMSLAAIPFFTGFTTAHGFNLTWQLSYRPAAQLGAITAQAFAPRLSLTERAGIALATGTGYNCSVTVNIPLSSYDTTILGESTALYYWPLFTSVGTEELVGNFVLTRNTQTTDTVLLTGALPNGDNALKFIGTNPLAPSTTSFSRTGESRMTISTGMVLECMVKVVAFATNQTSFITFNYGTWIWQLGCVSGPAIWMRVHAPGGQRTTMTASTNLVAGVWYHLAMRVNSTNSFGFNNATLKINSVGASYAESDDGGWGTPSGNGMAVSDGAVSGTPAEIHIAKCAVYSSLTDARITAHAQLMGPYTLSRTLLATGNNQAVLFPSATNLTADLMGASGGGTQPGLGGRIQATYPGIGATNFGLVAVGRQTGFNGGGAGGSTGAFNGSSGGGATDVRLGGVALSNRKIVAGGGGGTGQGAVTATGGNGGGTTGQAGTGVTGGSGGGGGTQSAGGTAGGPSTAGSLGIGGAAASSGGYTRGGGGGGGGGYYGGGGGESSNGVGEGGGGGGSNYVDPTCTSVTHTQGYSAATADGQAVLTWGQALPALGAVTLVGKSASASGTPIYPASGIQAGDLAVLVAAMENNLTPPAAFATAGWVLLATQPQGGAGSDTSISLRFCDGTENGTSPLSLGVGSNYNPRGVIYVFRGVTTIQVGPGDNYDITGSGTTITYKGVAPNLAGAFVLTASSVVAGAPGAVSGSSPTFTSDFSVAATSGSPGSMGMLVASATGVAASLISDRTSTAAGTVWSSLMVALSP